MKIFIVSLCVILGSTIVYGVNNESDQISFQGEIINDSGKPVVGAEIMIYDLRKEKYFPYTSMLAGSVTSDPEGFFSYSRHKDSFDQVYTSFVVIKAEGYPNGMLHSAALENNPRIILSSKKGGISGTVVDSGGTAVSGAVVYACIRPFTYFAMSDVPELIRFTDDNGRFSFDTFSYKTRADFYVYKDGYTGTYTFPTNSRPNGQYRRGDDDIKVVLMRAGSLSGQLLRSDTGEPLPGEKVSIVRDQPKGHLYTRAAGSSTVSVDETLNPNDCQTVETDSEGRFGADNLYPGDYHVFHHNNVSGLFTPILKVKIEEELEKKIKIESTAGHEVVLDSFLTGGSIADHEVRVVLWRVDKGQTKYTYFWESPLHGRFDGKSKYHFKVPPGQYRVWVVSETVEAEDDGKYIDVPSSEYPVVKMNAKKIERIKTLKGVCVDEKGNPSEGANVFLLSDPDNVVKTDSEGKFALTLRPEKNEQYFRGIYDKVMNDDRNYADIPVFFDKAEDMDPNKWVRSEVFLVAEDTEKNLSAMCNFYGYGRLQASLERGSSFSRRLVLKQGYTISGRVIDEKGNPQEDAYVEVRKTGGFGELYDVVRQGFTDAKGEFAFSCINADGGYKVVVTNSEGGYRIKYFGKRLSTGPDADYIYSARAGDLDLGDFLITAGSYSVSGIVVDLFGRPVSEPKLCLRSEAQGIDYRMIKGGKDGRFLFDGLSYSEVNLSAWVDKNRSRQFRTMPGKSDIRMVLGGVVGEDKVSGSPIPSAAVEMSFVYKDTGEPVTLPKATVLITPENGCSYGLNFGKEGKLRLLMGAGKHKIKFFDVGGKAGRFKAEFTTELYQSYKFRYELEP